MRNYVLKVAIAVAFTLSLVHIGSAQVEQFGGLPPADTGYARADEKQEATVDLYVLPDKLTEAQKAIQKTHPELFQTEAVVVIFGAHWCRPCKRQKWELKGPSNSYNILYLDTDPDPEKATEKEKKRGVQHAELAEKLGITIYPTTVVMEKGVIVKTFLGYTPWGTIRPFAEKAKKNEKERLRIDIGPIHIDFDDGVDVDRNRRRPRPRRWWWQR